MGAANVIPGVSGGTIAFISGIYDELISSLKSFDLKAIQLLFSFRIKELIQHVNAVFLLVLFSGAVFGIVSLGKLLKWAIGLDRITPDGVTIAHGYEPWVWAFFFGLILASVIFVGKTIKKWNATTITLGLIGIAIAIGLTMMDPGAENDNPIYLVVCGVVAMSSMLLPGLSGSFVLILMGNYYLIMIEAVQNKNFGILIFVGVGAILGFVLLSRVISFLLSKYQDATISALTGFIFGSLYTIWPWKNIIRETITKKDGSVKEVVLGYENWTFPEFSAFDFVAIGLMVAGFVTVFIIEIAGKKLVKDA